MRRSIRITFERNGGTVITEASESRFQIVVSRLALSQSEPPP
jgi:hypothetical protein